jgi:hypothetical protein
VVATAPIPTVSTPNFPFAAAIGNAFFATFFSSLSKVQNYCLHPIWEVGQFNLAPHFVTTIAKIACMMAG